MDIKELVEFTATTKIPQIKRRSKTFLEISKQPNYENVCSNIYAFFFNVNEEHQLNDLFIKSLIQTISSKIDREFSFFYENGFEIQTEYTTKKNGRIDILITTSDEAIIIENKIYHRLDNDLKDYWNSIKNENKQGVVLSLKPLATKNEKFINITHIELLKQVLNNLGEYFSDSSDKYIVFLKDFYLNIFNLTNPMEKSELEFYYKYEPQISAIQEIRKNLVRHIKNQVENACNQIEGSLVLSGKSKKDTERRLRYYQYSKNKDLMFTILFDSLLKKEKQLHIIIEVRGELLKRKELFKSIEFTSEEKELLKSDFYIPDNPYWKHFAVHVFDLTDTDIERLSEFIITKINEYFLTIFNKMTEMLD